MKTLIEYYDVLGLPKANKKEIKLGFRKIAKKHHPESGGSHNYKWLLVIVIY